MTTLTNYNPDVLSCLANLSNDEVFTPPGLVNDMLDLLPIELWSNPDVKFLDPVCKSGVFLREIAKRLMRGLEQEMPDLQVRLNHIFKNQLYGIAITELTSLLSRRSVYCSKLANGKYSVAEVFENERGNIHFERIEHTWENGKCKFCGASQSEYDREETLETHAYNFIHTENPEEILNMKFDVIIGNPPYQLSDGGFGKSAIPLYNKFVEQAKKLKPRFLVMVIPARWYGGGRGLDDFREEMLNDKQISTLVDFEDSKEIFPGVSIAGGVCYFLWEEKRKGECLVINNSISGIYKSFRSLNEYPKFIRSNSAISIVRKVLEIEKVMMSSQVSSYRPFGLRTYVKPQEDGELKLYWQGGIGPYRRKAITVGVEMIDDWKVISSRSGHEHAGNPSNDGRRRVLSKIDILPPGMICTETYLVIGSYKTEIEAINLSIYMRTKFFRFLLSQLMYSHGITKDTYSFIPVMNTKQVWTDEILYKRFDLSSEEINLIDRSIRSMD